MRDGKERHAVEVHFLKAGLFTEREVGEHVRRFVRSETYGGSCQERGKAFPCGRSGDRLSLVRLLPKCHR